MENKKSQHLSLRGIGAGMMLLILIWFVFGQTIGFDFIRCDDDLFVYENPLVLQGLTATTVYQAFTTIHETFYYPLTLVSFMANAELHGMNPAGFHLTNVFLHAGSVLLLCWFLCRLTKSFWKSVLVAALFAVHPLQVEAVAWVTARKDVLSGFFFILSLHAYYSYVQGSGLKGYAAVFFLLVAGLMSKPMLVTVPAVFLLLDIFYLNRWNSQRKRMIFEKLPLFALSLLFSIIAVVGGSSLKEGTPVIQPSVGWRIGNAVVSYAVYVRQVFFPFGLAMPYPQYDVRAYMVVLSMLVLAALCVTALLRYKKQPIVLMGWLWFLGMLFPVSGAVRYLGVARADRFVYLPLIGFFIFLVWGVGAFPWKRQRVVVASCVVVALSLLARVQTRHWRSDFTLWPRSLAVAGESTMAYINLGAALVEYGEFDTAEKCFQRAHQLDPADQEALYNLGWIRLTSGRAAEAIPFFYKVLDLNPARFDALMMLGAAHIALGDAQKGLDYSRRALEIRPHDPGARTNTNLAAELLREAESN